jgi:amino acid transporter
MAPPSRPPNPGSPGPADPQQGPSVPSSLGTPDPQQGSTDEDAALLGQFGYTQELRRRMGAFTNFAVSFSIICILAGGITAFPLALSAGGGLSVFLGWMLGALVAGCVALSMAQIASAFPTAGGLYHWASLLGGRGFGWATAWFNLLGLVLVVASVNVGLYDFFVRPELVRAGWLEDAPLPPEQAVFVFGLLAVQALLNHRAPVLVHRLIDLSGVLIMVLALVLVVSLVATATWADIDWQRLVRLERNLPMGGPSAEVDASEVALWAVFAGLILPLYTITGFDASAHAAEETRDAARVVPQGMVRSVLWSALFGGVLVVTFVLTLDNIPDAIAQGAGFFAALLERLPWPLRAALMLGLIVVNALCGLASLLSASRMAYAFARDGGLPASRLIAKVDPRHATPAAALWCVALAAGAFTLWADAFAVLSTACAVFLYLSYVAPIAAGLLAEGHRWQRKGPFSLGRASKACALAATLGALLLTLVGVQPPNDQVLWLIAALLALLGLMWWPLKERHRFQGPPPTSMR